MKLTLNTTTILQAATWGGLIVTESLKNNLVPEEYKHGALAVAAFLSVVLHQSAGHRNPDGTPAALPYIDCGAILSAASAAYEAYRAKSGGRSIATGAPIPEFHVLPQAMKDGWCAAAGAAQAVPPDKPVCEK